MKDKLLSWDWKKEFNDNSANRCWEIFKEILLCLQKEHIPLAVATTDPKPSWTNKEVCTALSLKRGSWKRYSMCKTDSNLEAYKKARYNLKQVTMNAKKGLERRVAEEVRTNPKSSWKFISKRTKRYHKIGRIRDENNLLTTSNEETADSFNKYFATVFVKEDAGFCIPSDSVIQGEHFTDIKLKEEKILKILE